jgi:HAD superfamily hydrolase (TIGR01484 family)
MHFIALASDYDGTLAEGGKVSPSTLTALEQLVASGRILILVTGRILDELLSVFPQAEICTAIVAENGAVLYRPATRDRTLLGTPAPEALVRALAEKGVHPLDVGESIVATLRPHEMAALEAITDSRLKMT